MKKVKQEVIRILLILIVQILISIFLSYLTDKKWSLKEMIFNYGFLLFWCAYIACSIGIRVVKKLKMD